MSTELLKKTLEEVWEDSEFFKLYQWTNFMRTMIKIWLVEHFIEDESHPWLSPPIETMSSWQFKKCISYIEKVVPKKRHVSI